MFKHTDPLGGDAAETKPKSEVPTVEEKIHQQAAAPTPSAELLRELMEKNLKWSQIIYEQNRKINRKLAWAAVAEWLRLLIIVVPLVVGTILLLPMMRQLMAQYGELLNMKTATSTPSFESIMKMVPLNSSQQEQLQQLMNK